MTKTELKKTVVKIKKLLKQRDYGNIDTGIELARAIGQLKNLECLNLSKNKWKKYPDVINQLQSLKTLEITGNPYLPVWNFTQLPESINKLINLENLNLKDHNFNDAGEKRIKELLPDREITF
jgi:Leucine-rich repeat (LRR) protein